MIIRAHAASGGGLCQCRACRWLITLDSLKSRAARLEKALERIAAYPCGGTAPDDPTPDCPLTVKPERYCVSCIARAALKKEV